jgi:hypothetical protein
VALPAGILAGSFTEKFKKNKKNNKNAKIKKFIYTVKILNEKTIMKLIIKFWNGDITLWKSFWIIRGGIALSSILFLNLVLNFTILDAITFLLPINVLLMIGVWKSANKYSGNFIWSLLAKVIMTITVIISIINLF